MTHEEYLENAVEDHRNSRAATFTASVTITRKITVVSQEHDHEQEEEDITRLLTALEAKGYTIDITNTQIDY